MEAEYKALKFHDFTLKFKHDSISNKLSDLEGIKCLSCKESCFGFLAHHWRRVCVNCKCPVWKHDIPSTFVVDESPFQRLGVEEIEPPPICDYEKAKHEGYQWLPRGWLTSKDKRNTTKYLPKDIIPKSDTKEANSRTRKIVHQLPEQDFNSKHAVFLHNAKSHKSFEDLKLKKVTDALGVGAIMNGVSQPTNCATCYDDIEAGETAVCAAKFDFSFVWHPSCFKCCIDGEVLVDFIYFSRDDRLYCGRHWSELFKPRCHGCDELIYVGEYTKAMNQAWHVDHFCCWQCDITLTAKQYIVINEQPFCQTCYSNIIANTCKICKEPIGANSKDLYVKDNHYHDACLSCGECGKLLENESFSFINENPICHICRGIDEIQTKKCQHCKKSFGPGQRKVGVDDDKLFYHEECFLCSECHQTIGSNKFIRKSDGKRICEKCFQLNVEECFKCGEMIKTSIVRFEKKSYHTKCFVCFNCAKEIGGVSLYKNDAIPYCEECYVIIHAKRCARCYQPIKGDVRFVEHEERFWHSTCFCCVICEQKLAGTNKFVVRNGSRFCMECKER